MTSKERFRRALAGLPVDRFLFEPAVYEHKAFLLGVPVAELAQSTDLIVEATLREAELYDGDAVTVGVDVYNVEAEAMGGAMCYDVEPGELPHIEGPRLDDLRDVTSLQVPNPEVDGRMPVLLEAAARVSESVGEHKVVRGAVSGPFSLAAELVGTERLLMALMDDPDTVRGLLKFTSRVSLTFGSAFLRCGVTPVYFDSRCSPPLVSPNQYREIILPVHAWLLRETKAAGAKGVPLIIGGDTTPIAADLAETGADYLLCDYPADFGTYRRLFEGHGILVRRNLNPGLLREGPVARIEEETQRYLEEARGWPGFVVGTGVVPWDTPPEHVLTVKRVIKRSSHMPPEFDPLP